MALQHLRSSTANKRPVPGNMSDGQLGINTNLASPGLFFKDTNGDLVKVGPVHVGTTAPNASPAAGGTAGNSVGEQWLDTTGGTYVFKVWDGSAWRSESGTFVDVNGDVMTGALGIIAGSAGAPGLYFSGDTNTGLYSPGADQLALSTNGTGRLFVDASGKISNNNSGNNPGQLNIVGKVAAGAVSAGTSPSLFGDYNFITDAYDDTRYLAWMQRRSSNARAWIGSIGGNNFTASLVFGTNGVLSDAPAVERMRITSAGLVGIGTSSPATILHLVKSDSTVYAPTGASAFPGGESKFLLGNPSNTNGASSLIQLSANNAAAASHIGYFGVVSESSGFTPSIVIGQRTGSASYAERIRISPTGNVGIGTTSPGATLDVFTGSNRYVRFSTNGDASLIRTTESGGANRGFSVAGEYIKFDTGTNAGSTINEAARIDSSGRLLVGTSTSGAGGEVFQIVGTSQETSATQIRGIGATMTPATRYARSRGTLASPLAVGDGDGLGAISFRGYDGSADIGAAAIVAFVDGTPGANDMPGRLVFSTTADGASSPTEQLRITSNRYVRLASGTGGIQFNGDTAAANALDDYEEGTWTPVLTGTTTAGTYTLSNLQARYTKVGNLVTVAAQFGFSSITDGTGAGLDLAGLPFNYPAIGSTRACHGSITFSNLTPTTFTLTGDAMGAYVAASASIASDSLAMYVAQLDGSSARIRPTDVTTSTTIFLSFSYTV